MDAVKIKQMLLDNCMIFFALVMAPYLYFYFNYPLYDIDTGWFAESPYTWLRGGPMAMLSWPGVYGMDQYTYWFPPMIFWLQIPVYAVLGFGILQDNVLLLSIFLLAMGLTYLIAKKFYDGKIAKISFVLLLSSPLYNTFALYANRPDVLVGVFNLLAVFFFFKSWKNEKYLYLSGVLGALSVSSHMAGLLIAPSIGIVAAYENRKNLAALMRKEARIIAGFLAGILPWMLYAANNFPLFISQLYWNTKGDLVLSLLHEWERISGLFLHKSMLLMAPVLLLALYFGLKSKNRTDKVLVFIILFHVLILSLVSHKSPRYYSSVLPLWFMLSARAMQGFFESKDGFIRRASSSFFVLAAIFSIFSYAALFVLMVHSNNYLSLNEHMSEAYLLNSRDRAFLAQPAYFLIFKEKMYAYTTLYYRGGLYNESFAEIMAELRPDYILFDSHMSLHTSGAKEGIGLDLKNFIEKNTTSVETICYIGDKRADPQKTARRQNHNYFELLKAALSDKDLCIDPVTVYRARP